MKFREPEVAYVAKEMFTGLTYMHAHKVIHRDLKSANVMMTVKAEIKVHLPMARCLFSRSSLLRTLAD